MKATTRLMIAGVLMVTAHNVPSQGLYDSTSHINRDNYLHGSAYSYDGGKMWQHYSGQTSTPRVTRSQSNILGGHDYYGPGGYVGRSRSNILGGHDYDWNY